MTILIPSLVYLKSKIIFLEFMLRGQYIWYKMENEVPRIAYITHVLPGKNMFIILKKEARNFSSFILIYKMIMGNHATIGIAT